MHHIARKINHSNYWGTSLFITIQAPYKLPQRGYKAILVKIVCLRKPALVEKTGVAYGTGETLLRVHVCAYDLTTWMLAVFVTGIQRTWFKEDSDSDKLSVSITTSLIRLLYCSFCSHQDNSLLWKLLTDDTLSWRDLWTRKTAALIMFLSSSLGVAGDTSESFLCTARRASSLQDQVLEYAPATCKIYKKIAQRVKWVLRQMWTEIWTLCCLMYTDHILQTHKAANFSL